MPNNELFTANPLKIVGVMGSGTDEHNELAQPLGQLIAQLGANLLTGGGQGVMKAVSRAFCQVRGRRGVSIGILPAQEGDPLCSPKPGYPNEWIEIPIHTHLPYSGNRGTTALSRNHINILSSNAIVALPGGWGTASEVKLALRYQKRLIAFLGESERIEGLDSDVSVVHSLDKVEQFLRQALALQP